MDVIFNASTNLLTLRNLKNAATGNNIPDATVTAQLLDGSNVVVSAVGTLSLTYVPSSPGDYQGTAPSTMQIATGAYTWKVLITDAQGNKRVLRKSVQVSD